MKNIKNLAIFTLAAIFLTSCGGLNKMVKDAGLVSYDVNPQVLEEHGGTVDQSITVTYPAKYFNKKAVVTLTPLLKYEGGELALDPLVLQGQDATDNNKPISFDEGGSASVETGFPYDATMMLSELHLNMNAKIGDKEADLGSVKIADGIIATPQLVCTTGKAILFGNSYKQIVPEAYEADITYMINRADVRRSEMKKDEMSKLNETLLATAENERLNLTGVEISAYASPDGELDLNTKLADKRQSSAQKYFEGQMKKTKVEVADELMNLLSTPEDWDGFKKAMEESNIQDKEMILRVLSMHSDPVVREQEIRNLSAAFEVIADEILPALRRSKFTVNMEKVGFSDEELKEQWASNPDTLGLEELLYTATLCEDKDKQLAIYKKACEVAPECVRAHSNKGVILFNMGNVEEAEAAFNAAKGLKDHDIVNNNLGVIALKNGDVAAAKEAFTASLGAGPEVNYNLGIVSIKEGDYETAVNYFGSEPSVNASLAMYLAGDDEGAWRTAANLEKTGAKRYYVLAVIAASQDKPDVAMDNLKLAVENCKDPQKIKDYAKKDLEFAKLFEEEKFKAIVE